MTEIRVANFNIANHNHVINFANCPADNEEYPNRYIRSIEIIIDMVNTHGISIVFLSEVTQEFFDMWNNNVGGNEVYTFIDIKKGLMTIFFNTPTLILDSIKEFQVEKSGNRDRLQIFNVIANNSLFFTTINIHGFGDPNVRQRYLISDLEYITQLIKLKTINSSLLLCGDFNSSSDQIIKAISNYNTYFYIEGDQPTSFHNKIKVGDVFIDKPKDQWYTKMDHLIFTSNFIFENASYPYPEDFSYYQHPYDCYTENNGWPSDHTFNMYIGYLV
jgi:hypothetical protein